MIVEVCLSKAPSGKVFVLQRGGALKSESFASVWSHSLDGWICTLTTGATMPVNSKHAAHHNLEHFIGETLGTQPSR
jgi:hypothetical protein